MSTHRYLGPGGVPKTRAEALRVSRGSRERIEQALGVYRFRAGDLMLQLNDEEGPALDELAEQYGTTREEIDAGIDKDRSLEVSAMADLVSDVMLHCDRTGMGFGLVVNLAAKMYHAQKQGMIRVLVHEIEGE